MILARYFIHVWIGVEDVSEDDGEGGQDILSLLLLFNLDHCVDIIASNSSCVSVWNCEKNIEFSGHLDVFSLGTAACVCSSWRKWGLFVLEFFNLIEVFISKKSNSLSMTGTSNTLSHHRWHVVPGKVPFLLPPSSIAGFQKSNFSFISPSPSPTFQHYRFSGGTFPINSPLTKNIFSETLCNV